jgi:transposase
METLWLKSYDLPHAMIAKLAGISENTMREYFFLYKEGGLDKLKERPCYRPSSTLQNHAFTLEAHLREHPPSTIKKAQHEIEKLTGIKRSTSQVRHFLREKLGIRCRKIGMIPVKDDPGKQSSKNMSGRCVGRLEPTPSLKTKNVALLNYKLDNRVIGMMY